MAEPTPVDLGEQWDGHIIALAGGGFAEVCDGTTERLAVPKSAIAEMRLLLKLRDQAGALLARGGRTRHRPSTSRAAAQRVARQL